MAGQAGLHCRHHFQTGQHPLRLPASFAFRRQDLLLDACLGITLYKVNAAKLGTAATAVVPRAGFVMSTNSCL